MKLRSYWVSAVLCLSITTIIGSHPASQLQYYYNDPCGGDPCCGQYCCYQAVTSSSEPGQLRPPYDCPYQAPY